MAFPTQYGLYKWVVMAMGSMNTPVMLIGLMNNLFVKMMDKGVLVFLDFLLIYSDMVEDCFEPILYGVRHKRLHFNSSKTAL